MKFRFRVLRPIATAWIEAEAASIEDAIQDYHALRCAQTWADNSVGIFLRNQDGTPKEQQWFAVFEDETGTELISRICCTGLWRSGGVRRRGPERTMADVARELGVEPGALSEGEWPFEESQDEVLSRRHEGYRR